MHTHIFILTQATDCTQIPVLNVRFTGEPASKQERPLQNPQKVGRCRTGPAERPSEPESIRATWSCFLVPIREGHAARLKGLALHKAFKTVVAEMLFLSWESSDCKQSF